MNANAWRKTLSILLLLGLCLSLVQPATRSQAFQARGERDFLNISEKPDVQVDFYEKIEPYLRDKLTTEVQVNFFVWMAEKADLAPASSLETKEEKGQFVFEALNSTADRSQADLSSYLDGLGVSYKSFYIANKVFIWGGTQSLALNIASRPDVLKLTANHYYQLPEPIKPAEVQEKLLGVEPNISFVNADNVWAIGVTGANTVVAGNDTGLDETHPAIARHYRGCLNPPTCTSWDHNYNWWDATNTYPLDPYDGHGHGTHTTGIMVGDDGGSNQIGMAPGAQTIHCKNMDNFGGGYDLWFETCFEWDLAPWDLTGANPDPMMAPDAVNNSWGYWGGGFPQFEDEIAALQAAGIVVEVSAGNEGPWCTTLRSPGDYEEVLTTGSVNHAYPFPGSLTGFSSRGPSSLYPGAYFPDIMAPGESIRSSLPGGWYDWWSGTSMAGPHSTALVGLIWSAAPALRGQVQQTIQIIKDTAVPLTGEFGSNCGGDYTEGPNNDWGYGTIDALAAVQLAISLGGAGSLNGTVTDAGSGMHVQGATINALHDQGYSWLGYTDATGYYTMTVAAGTFDVTASHPQYMSSMVSGVVIVTDTVTTQDFALTPRGHLFGYVTDFDNGFPLEATVTADDGTTAYTDPANGYYEMYLDPATYVITATATDYAPEAATVYIFSGVDTQQDFSLLAAVTFVPSPIEKSIDYGDTDSQLVTITNRLSVPYNFEFVEGQAGFNPVLATEMKVSGHGEWLYRDTSGALMKNNLGEEVLAFPSAYRWMANPPSQVNVLIYADDYYHWAPNTFLDQALQALGMSYTAHYDGDFYGFVNDLQTGTWDMVLVGNDNYWDTSIFYPLNDYVMNGGKLVINTWTMSSDPSSPLWSTLGVTWMYDDWDPPDNTYWWDPSNAVFNNPQSVPEFTQLLGYRYGTYGQHVTWMDGFEALAGYTSPGPDPGEAALVLGNDGRTIFKGFLDGQNDADQDLDGMFDGVELWINMISGLESGFGGDVRWFNQVPISGTVPALSTINATMLFTATAESGVEQPGDYYLTLTMNGDPGTPDIKVPVTMTVLSPLTWGKLDGTVTGLGYCDITPAPLKNADVLIEAATGMSWTVQTDASGHYQWWLDEANSPLTVTVTYPEHLTGQASGVLVVGQQTTTVDFDLRWQKPCLSTNPTELSASLDMGDSTILGLELINDGDGDTGFKFLEQDLGYIPTGLNLPSFLSTLTKGSTAPENVTSTNAPNGYEPVLSKLNLLTGIIQDGTVAIFKDYDPWGTMDVEAFLSANGIAYEIHGSAEFGTLDFDQYSMIIFSGDQPQFFYDEYANYVWKFEEYVENGGFLNFFACDSGWNGGTLSAPLPSGMSWTGWIYENYNIIDDPTHPVVQGVPDPFFGDYASHGHFGNLPAEAHIIASEAMGGQPTIVEYPIGAGWLIAFGQPLEISHSWGWDAAMIMENTLIWGYSYVPSLDVPWLSENPVTGTLPADSSLMIDVTFDAGMVDQPGEHLANLKLKSDDPINPTILLPVTMNVAPPEDWGKLEGSINSMGHCDANPWPLAEAQIVIESSTGITWTIQSSDDGSYIRWLDEAGNPYTLTVSASGHEPTAETVTVTAGQTTIKDIDLRWMVPCLSVDPVNLDLDVALGFSWDEPLTLINQGGGDGMFEIRKKGGTPLSFGTPNGLEKASGYIRVVEDEITKSADKPLAEGIGPDAGGGPDPYGYVLRDSNELEGPIYEWIEIAPPAGGSGTPLYLSGNDDAYYWPLQISFPFNFYGVNYTQLAVNTNGTIYFEDNWLGYSNEPIPGNPGIDAFIAHLWDDLYVTPGEVYYLDLGDRMIIEYYQVSGCCISPATATWEVILFDNGNMLFQYQDTTFGDFRDHGGDATIGIQGDPATGLQYSYNTPVLSDGLAICFAYPGNNPGCVDDAVPWLLTDPSSGFVPHDYFTDVSVMFSALPTFTVGTTYTATLRILSDDMMHPEISVPVSMTVVAPITALDVDAPITSLIGDQGTILTHTLTVTNMSNHIDAYDLDMSNYWWATWGPSSVGPLKPGESETVNIQVAIPPTVLPGSSDTVVVKAISQAFEDVFDSIALTTTAAEYVATLTPEAMTLAGLPGHMVTYTLMLENTGNVADTFAMMHTNNSWDVQIVGETSMDLEPGESHAVTIQVRIPEEATEGDWDMVVIEVYGTPGQVAAAQLTTNAIWARVYMPMVHNDHTP